MIDPTIKTRFMELPVSYRNFVVSDFPREVVDVFAPTLKLSPSHIDVMENGLILYLLFFFTQNELVTYLVKNTGADTLETEAVISTICKNLPDFANNEVYEQTRLELSGKSALNTEIAEAENVLRSIEGLRTMPHDMEVAQGHPVMQAPATETTYQSSQADILQPGTPAPVANEAPRWDTE